ncbi:MAG TPA: hypothetical protein VKB38_06090 [Terracidiphilus sp.]|nr:hypothetical protein [Terracidiphilus sp.]
MLSTRRGILSLVAAGRISAAEGERLLAAWNDGREGLWIAVACVLVCAAQMHLHILPGEMIHFAREVAREGMGAVHNAVFSLMSYRGGRI